MTIDKDPLIPPTVRGLAARQALAQRVTGLFTKWGLSGKDQCDALGLLPPSGLSKLVRFHRGQALDNTDDMLQRALLLILIGTALELFLASDTALARVWLNAPQAVLNNQCPLEAISTHGIIGLQQVWNGLFDPLAGTFHNMQVLIDSEVLEPVGRIRV